MMFRVEINLVVYNESEGGRGRWSRTWSKKLMDWFLLWSVTETKDLLLEYSGSVFSSQEDPLSREEDEILMYLQNKHIRSSKVEHMI